MHFLETLEEATHQSWSLVHGLFLVYNLQSHLSFQGKPSAGKSTFFNAAVQQNRAKTAQHPFTTIEPNIAKGFYTTPCPCERLEFTCDAGWYRLTQFTSLVFVAFERPGMQQIVTINLGG